MNSLASASASNFGLLGFGLELRDESGCDLFVGVVLDGGLLPLTSLLEPAGVLCVFGVSLLEAFFTALFSSNMGSVPVKISEYLIESNLYLSLASR